MTASSNGKNAAENAGVRLAPPSPKNGARLRVGPGLGGKKGRSGRKPDEFKAALAQLADDAVKRGYVAKILKDPNHPQFMAALKWATDYGYGPVPRAHQVTGADGGPITLVVQYGDEDGDA